jgi:hypothetical protein
VIQENTCKVSDHLRPVLTTVLVFALAGPPIGALVLAALILVTGQETGLSGIVERVPAISRMFANSIPQSYALGGLQASAAGLLLSGYGLYRGRPSIGIAAVIGAVTWAGFYWFAVERDILENVVMMLVHVFSAIICARISRRFWTRET